MIARLVRVLGLLRIAKIFKAIERIVEEEDRPNLVGANVAPGLIENAGAEGGIKLADGARFLEPLFRADEKIAMTLGRREILPKDRTPPGDHGAFNVRRGGRCAMEDPSQARDIVLLLHEVRQRQKAVEHGRNHVRVSDAMFVDEAQRLFGVELLHHHDGRAIELREHDVPIKRSAMIARPAEKIYAWLASRIDVEILAQDHRPAERALAQDALWPPRRARRIEHARTHRGMFNVGGVFSCERRAIILKSLNWSAH